MVEDKIGKKPYLGIEIDYDKEKNFNKFSIDTLKDRYFWDKETTAQEALARASVFGATFKGDIDFDSSKPDGSPRKLLDSKRIQNLGFKHEINLMDGLKKTYKEFIKFNENI